jgi:hypothetical protein
MTSLIDIFVDIIAAVKMCCLSVFHHDSGDDYKDLMAGVDDILKRRYIDANRLGVTGGSGRRAADQLDDHADAALQGCGRAARHRRLVRLLVHAQGWRAGRPESPLVHQDRRLVGF